VLSLSDAAHSHAAESLALVQHHVLAIQDGLHAHAADNLDLVVHGGGTPLQCVLLS